MNIRFIPTSSEAVADALSRALWGLSRPESIRAPGEVSEAWCVVRPDAVGQYYVMVDTEESIPVHAEAVLDGIAGILAGAGISQAEIDTLAAVVIATRGGIMTPWDYFPQAFKDVSRTEEQITWPTRA